MVRLDDLTVYKRLISISEELDRMAGQCWSPATATAIKTCAAAIRRIASAVFKRSLEKVADSEKPR
jgi:hypothetical protein